MTFVILWTKLDHLVYYKWHYFLNVFWTEYTPVFRFVHINNAVPYEFDLLALACSNSSSVLRPTSLLRSHRANPRRFSCPARKQHGMVSWLGQNRGQFGGFISFHFMTIMIEVQRWIIVQVLHANMLGVEGPLNVVSHAYLTLSTTTYWIINIWKA